MAAAMTASYCAQSCTHCPFLLASNHAPTAITMTITIANPKRCAFSITQCTPQYTCRELAKSQTNLTRLQTETCRCSLCRCSVRGRGQRWHITLKRPRQPAARARRFGRNRNVNATPHRVVARPGMPSLLGRPRHPLPDRAARRRKPSWDPLTPQDGRGLLAADQPRMSRIGGDSDVCRKCGRSPPAALEKIGRRSRRDVSVSVRAL